MKNTNIINGVNYGVSIKDPDIINKLKSIPELMPVLEAIQNFKKGDNIEYLSNQRGILTKWLVDNQGSLDDLFAEYNARLQAYDTANSDKLRAIMFQRQQLDNSNENKLPSMPRMALNFVKSAADFAKSGLAIASDEQYEERLAICNSCPKLDSAAFNGTGRCTACGCSIKTKLKMLSSTCPLKKW